MTNSRASSSSHVLATYDPETTISTHTYTKTFTDADYAYIEVEIIGSITAALNLRAEINGYSGSTYVSTGQSILNTTITSLTSSSVGYWSIGTAAILATAAEPFHCTLKIYLSSDTAPASGYPTGHSKIIDQSGNSEIMGHSIQNDQSSTITSIRIFTSTSTLVAGTKIIFRGIK